MSQINIICFSFLVLGIYAQCGHSCLYPKEDFREEVSAAILWSTLKPDINKCASFNYAENSSQVLKLDSENKVSGEKILRRRKRIIYIERAPFISAEFRYVFPIFPVNRDLKTFVNLEVPINYFINVKHWEFNIARGGRDFAAKSSDVFMTIEEVLSTFGFKGRSCVQRSICEVSSLSPLSAKGILKDMMTVVIKHMFRSSSSSDNNNTTSPYFQAAMEGRSGKERCDLLFKDCPISLLGLVQHSYDDE